jgi:glutamate-ammonia-ligase adenylyltransferase
VRSGAKDPCARPPGIGDPALAERGLARFARLGLSLPRPAGDVFDPERLLAVVFGNSSFLTEALLADPDVLVGLIEEGPTRTLGGLLEELDRVETGQRSRLMRELRRVRKRFALLVGLADLAGLWSLDDVTTALSSFADGAIGRALEQTLSELHERGEIALPEPERPQLRSGLVVLGMGKLGAAELNYSSDVDLIVLFDPARFHHRGRESPMASAVRLTRTLVHLLEQATRDGYVLRVDLRLRPHPPGHPLALSTEDALLYYERHGQNWERAALIKARPVAGDREAGDRFFGHLQPFLWRRHLDYAAIRDIHSIKRQINAYRGHSAIRVAGHDIKVGRGGIREIEFFAQTQQLILGGREPEIRTRATCHALRALAARRWLAPAIRDELIQAYTNLRTVEHRLQMVADRQTHRLPEAEPQLARFATFMGFENAGAFADAIRADLETVERHYAALFESSLDLGAGRALVFTGTEDDPDTLTTLREMGFAAPGPIAARIRAWHHGHIRATRDARARELLTELMPRLLRALAEQAEPDATFARFDEFVTHLPAGVQLFSLFRANPRLLELIADLMGAAPRLASHLSHNTALFEAMLAPDFFEPLPDCAALVDELTLAHTRARDLQDVLDLTRRFAQAREFQIGLNVLLGQADGAEAGHALAEVADAVIKTLLPRVEAWLAQQHGVVPGGAFVVIGLGKLGSRELTLGSDLDLIFVYDGPEDATSDGPRPLPAQTYYGRLGQRLISALTARTPEGRLYEIDTRLRPSGNVGPVACSLANFARYHADSAQTWEHQALTRARVIAGSEALRDEVDGVVAEVLTRPRDPDRLAHDVGQMRWRIFREHGDADPWNLKHTQGGLLEAEFLAQYLQLRLAPEHPDVLTPRAVLTFARAAELGVLDAGEASLLIRAVELYRRLQAVLRLSIETRFDPKVAPRGLREALVRAAGHGGDGPPPDFGMLDLQLQEAEAAVHAIFTRLCPADPPDPGGGESAR